MVRYGTVRPGWVVSPAENPKVEVNLDDPVTGESPFVTKIIVDPHVNVEKVKIVADKVLDNGNKIEFSDKITLDITGEIKFQRPIRLSQLKVSFSKVFDETKDIEVKVGIVACFVDHSKYVVLMLHAFSLSHSFKTYSNIESLDVCYV